MWTYEFTPSNVVTETMTVPISATNGISFKTTILRSVEDNRGDISREETYVLTEEGRELLSWVGYARDGAGHEIKRITSEGKIVERAWSCCGPEWEKDERGIITDYSYDALGRQVTTTRNGITTFRMYDLLGNVTNEIRFAGSLFVSSSTGYDSAGRIAWSVGEDGARTEYVYSTSSEGGEVRTTIQAAGTDCAVTNTDISLRDGSTKAMYLNGVLKTTEVHEPFASLIYEGTNGIASARWSRSESDFLGRTVAQSRPGFGGSTLVTSNYYDTAGNLVSTLSLSTRSTRSTRLNSKIGSMEE
jgi:YD repeat-containing protein